MRELKLAWGLAKIPYYIMACLLWNPDIVTLAALRSKLYFNKVVGFPKSSQVHTHAHSPSVDRDPLAVVSWVPWNPTRHSYMPSAPTPTSEIVRVEVFRPAICVSGSSDVGLSHSNVRPLGGSPIVMQLKVTLVPRSTPTTSSTEAAEGKGREGE